ncbi:MAG: hypothetical protein EXR98_07345 [Gemmataceae bacterium]|nr:hypothetical protein [Gemmataceae bacterium]
MLHSTRCLFVWLVAVLMSIVVGCSSGPALPKTYAAGGTVTEKGGQVLKGGTIHFMTKSDPLLRVTASIKDDGTFSLFTLKDTSKADGAPDGEYEVEIHLPLSQDKSGGLADPHKGVAPIRLPATYTVKAEPNHFKIVLP